MVTPNKPSQRPASNLIRTGGRYRQRNQMLTSLAKNLVEEWAEACLVLDQEYELLVHFGQSRKFLSIPNAPDGLNVLNMLNPDIASVIRTGVPKAIKGGKGVRFQFVPSDQRESGDRYTIHIKPFYAGEGTEPLILITFHLVEEMQVVRPASGEELSLVDSLVRRVQELESEVEISRETLQNTVEELQASNEELLTSNEELQATIEELQSVNEELQTINDEYQSTIRTLSALNEDMRYLMQSSNMGVLFLDADFRIRKFNDLVTEEINIGVADHGRPIAHFSTQLIAPDLLDWIAEVQRSQMAVEHMVQNQKGRTLQVRITPCRYRDREPVGILILLFDLTDIQNGKQIRDLAGHLLEREQELKSAKQVAQQFEGNYKRLLSLQEQYLEASHSAMLIVSINGKVKGGIGLEAINEYLDVEVDAFIQDFLPSDIAEKFHSAIRRTIEREELQAFTFQLPKQQQTFSCTWMMQNSHMVSLLIKNISGAMQQEVSLQERDTQLRLLAANVPDGGALIFDREMKVQMHVKPSPGFPRLGESLTLLPNADHLKKVVEQCLVGHGTEMELELKGDNYLLSFLTLTKEAHTPANAGMLVYHRITQAKRTQRALEARLQDMERFTYSVSHDLKTPLRTITSFSQLLLRNHGPSLDEGAQEYLDFIVRNTRRMSRLVGGLLDYARLGAEDQEVAPVKLEALLPGLKQSFQTYLEEQQVELTWEALPVVKAYGPWVLQVFQNLVENGIKFNQSELKKIHISSMTRDGMAILEVRDNGIGIDARYQNQIFEVFQHLNNREQYEGSGLGLAVCKQIVEHLGGKIWLDSQPGEGTSFFFSLPLAGE